MGLKRHLAGDDLQQLPARATERDLQGLLAQLGDADAGVRRRGARDLGAHAGAAAPLCAHLAQESDSSVCEAVFTALARIGGTAVVDSLLPLLRSEDTALRNGALEVLAGMPEVVAPHLQALLHDADADVRTLSICLLSALPQAKVSRWLADVLQHETEVNVVGAALEAAAELAGPEAADAVRCARARFAGDAFIAFAADLVLKRIGAGG
jgi:HEAT repeat protein